MDTATFLVASASIGATLLGFYGVFLAFRIQREAFYYRRDETFDREGNLQSVRRGNEQHFTASFALLIFGMIETAIGCFWMPLRTLLDANLKLEQTIPWILRNFFASLLLVGGYFLVEIAHYKIILGKRHRDTDGQILKQSFDERSRHEHIINMPLLNKLAWYGDFNLFEWVLAIVLGGAAALICVGVIGFP